MWWWSLPKPAIASTWPCLGAVIATVVSVIGHAMPLPWHQGHDSSSAGECLCLGGAATRMNILVPDFLAHRSVSVWTAKHWEPLHAENIPSSKVETYHNTIDNLEKQKAC